MMPSNKPATDYTLSSIQRINLSRGGSHPTYSWGGTIALASSPTDILTLSLGNEGFSPRLRRLRIQIIAGSGSEKVPVLLTAHAANSGGTSSSQSVGARDPLQPSSGAATLTTYTANPTVGGSSRTLDAGYCVVNGDPLEFDFTKDGGRLPCLRGLFDGTARVLALNLSGTSIAGSSPTAIVSLAWDDEPVTKLLLVGDSLISAATTWQSYMQRLTGVMDGLDVRFFGSNGKRLIDYLPTAEANTSGLTYPFSTTLSTLPDMTSTGSTIPPIVVMHYLTNDIRTGDITLAEAVHRLNAFLYIMKNGCTSGQTWTSSYTGSDGTNHGTRDFTWNATLSPRRNARIWLMSPNSYLSDDPTAGSYITNTGTIAGANLAAAAQNATNMAYNAYEAFRGDKRVEKILHPQTFGSGMYTGQAAATQLSFGRTCVTGANNPLMTDMLHPNATGQYVKGLMIKQALGY